MATACVDDPNYELTRGGRVVRNCTECAASGAQECNHCGMRFVPRALEPRIEEPTSVEEFADDVCDEAAQMIWYCSFDCWLD